MRQIHFFALKEDILDVLEDVESRCALKYIPMDHIPTARYESFACGTEIPSLGKATTDHGGQEFLVTKREVPITPRQIPAAGVYAMDQFINPDTVTFLPGGIFGEDIVLSGRVATVSDSATAQELMKRFNSAIRKRFTKVKAFWVGPKAYELLMAGKRLTGAPQCPPEYDLSP